MPNSESKRSMLLGMSTGKATHILTRDLLFKHAQSEGNKCFRCGGEMTRDNFSIEHKTSWMSDPNPAESFFDLENVTYSHKKCNSKAGLISPDRKKAEHGSTGKYASGCRCLECKSGHAKYHRKYYSKDKRREKYLRLGT